MKERPPIDRGVATGRVDSFHTATSANEASQRNNRSLLVETVDVNRDDSTTSSQSSASSTSSTPSSPASTVSSLTNPVPDSIDIVDLEHFPVDPDLLKFLQGLSTPPDPACPTLIYDEDDDNVDLPSGQDIDDDTTVVSADDNTDAHSVDTIEEDDIC